MYGVSGEQGVHSQLCKAAKVRSVRTFSADETYNHHALKFDALYTQLLHQRRHTLDEFRNSLVGSKGRRESGGCRSAGVG